MATSTSRAGFRSASGARVGATLAPARRFVGSSRVATAVSPYLLRPMTLDDIPLVSEIERQSFPTMWPQTAYKRELQQNAMARYLVVSGGPQPPVSAPASSATRSKLARLRDALAR